jgi:rhodanese-related sulfurtransferase
MHRSRTAAPTAPSSRIAAVLEESRRNLDRVEPADLAAEMAAGALVVDTRPAANRAAEGPLPGAVVIERTVLEWRLDPTSPDRIPEADDPDRRVIVVCNEGYSSSLAAEMLQRLGLRRATDLVGGYRKWRELNSSADEPVATAGA